MKTLRDLLPKKEIRSLGALDEETVFHICRRVLLEMYGTRGSGNITPVLYKEQRLFLSPQSSLWGNEISLEREALRQRINDMIGSDAVKEIVLSKQG